MIPRPFLPVLAGHVVESAEVSDRFLWDFRRTLADLFSSSFYGTMEKQLKANGMGSYAEASVCGPGNFRKTRFSTRATSTSPWPSSGVHALHPESMYYVWTIEAPPQRRMCTASRSLASEAYTGGSYESPYTLKKIADFWFAQGVNRLVFHTSAQQRCWIPNPGNTMCGHAHQPQHHVGRAGQAFHDLHRPQRVHAAARGASSRTLPICCRKAHLRPCRSGAPVCSLLLLRATTTTTSTRDALLHLMSVDANGRLVLPDGMSYRVLVLPPTRFMTPEVLQQDP